MNPGEIKKFNQTADNKLDTTTEPTTDGCVTGYEAVENADGTYGVERIKVAQIGENKYETLAAAFAAAVTGDEIIVIEDVALTADDTVAAASDGKAVLLAVENKDITLNLNGKKIRVIYEKTEEADRLYAVVYVEDGASLTVTGNGTIDVTADTTTPRVAYLFWKRGTTGSLTIENGTYHMNHSEDSMIYTNGDPQS